MDDKLEKLKKEILFYENKIEELERKGKGGTGAWVKANDEVDSLYEKLTSKPKRGKKK